MKFMSQVTYVLDDLS